MLFKQQKSTAWISVFGKNRGSFRIAIGHGRGAMSMDDELQESGFCIVSHKKSFDYFPSDDITLSLSCNSEQVKINNPTISCKGRELEHIWHLHKPHHFKFTSVKRQSNQLEFRLNVLVNENNQLISEFYYENKKKTSGQISMTLCSNCCNSSKFISSLFCTLTLEYIF